MKLDFRTTGFFALATLIGYQVQAGVPEYGITTEFLTVCGAEFDSAQSASQLFLDAQWKQAGSDYVDALKPDDFLTKVRKVKAFTVELDNGAEWMAATAEGKFNGIKVAYCALTAVDDDPDGYRQDFERATEMKPSGEVSNAVEDRRIYPDSSGSVFVMREVRTPDASLFRYIKLSPIAAKGK